MRPLKALGLLVGSLAVVLAVGAPARAQTVDHYFGSFGADFVNTSDCGFPVHWVISGQFHEEDFYNASGNLTKFIATQGHGAAQVTATAKGVALSGAPQNFVETQVYNPDGSVATTTISGIFLQMTVPGSGSVLAQVGRQVFEGDFETLIFQAGPNEDFGSDHADFCAAFG